MATVVGDTMSTDNGSGRTNSTLPVQGVTPFSASQACYHIVRAKPGAPAQGICINPSIHGAIVHYVEGRSHECTAKQCRCPWCADGNRLRWYGFMPVLLPTGGRIGLIELTEKSVTDCHELQGMGSLRGKGIKVARLGEGKRSRCALSFEDYRAAGRLPSAIDTEQALRDIWGHFALPRAFPDWEEVPLQ